MQSILVKLAVAAAISSLGAFGADQSLGIWKLNVEKSKFSPTAPVKSLLTTRNAIPEGGGAIVISTGELPDGTKVNANYTVKYDGRDYGVQGAPWDTISIKQVDGNTFTTVMKQKSGKYNATGRMVVSKDGKTMTTTSKGVNAEGKPFEYTMVWEKQVGDQSGVDASISTHSTPITPAKPKPGK